jgi:hypothetical protein
MDTGGLERVERFRINLNEKNFATEQNTLTASVPQRCRAVGTYGSGKDTLVNVSHRRAVAKKASNSGGTGRSRCKLVERYPAEGTAKLTVYREAQRPSGHPKPANDGHLKTGQRE